MYSLQVVYISGKKYILPFDIVERFVDAVTVEKIKSEVLKELNKL